MQVFIPKHRLRLLMKYILGGVVVSCALLLLLTFFTNERFPYIQIGEEHVSLLEVTELVGNVEFPRRPELRDEIARRTSPEGWVIIPAVVDAGYAEMAHNFYRTSIERLGLADNTLFLCVHEAACRETREHGVPALMYRAAVSSATDVFNSRTFIAKAMTKHLIIFEVLLMGYSVLLTDLDMYWFRSPIADLRRTCADGCDFAIQDEAGEGLNIGFVYVRPTRASLAFYEKVVAAAADPDNTLGAQKLFNELVAGAEKGSVSYKVLSRQAYPDGQTYFESGRRLFFDENPCWYCFIAHNNWIVGTEAKRFRFREHAMWTLDTGAYYSDTTRKYVRYENLVTGSHRVPEYERAALGSALAIARVLKRTLVLPRYFHADAAHRVPLNGVLLIKHFDEAYGGRYRESSFLYNAAVPERTRYGLCGKILINSSFYRRVGVAEKLKDVRHVFTPRDPERGASEQELRAWLGGPAFADCMVLDFHSLYSAFAGFTNSSVQTEHAERFNFAYTKGGYRQLELLR